MADVRYDVLVIGGGPAGIAAAVSAARAGARVMLLDMQAEPGGQIWRGQWRTRSDHAAKTWMDAFEQAPVECCFGARLVAVPDPHSVLVDCADGARTLRFAHAVIATGARELHLPFPGWTLPGVFGAGGLQALAKNGWPVAGKRVLVAGSGPLLLAVADSLRNAGAHVLAIVEQASHAAQLRFATALLRAPRKLGQALGYGARLRGIPRYANAWVEYADGDNRVRRVTVNVADRHRVFDVDCLAVGYGLVPNLEVAAAFGCDFRDGAVRVDARQTTSVAHVYCAGEGTGIGGVDQALAQGEIAGYAAAGHSELAGGAPARRRAAQRFGASLARTFALRPQLRTLAADDTVLCRCEDVPYGAARACTTQREAKLHTRLGMGHCQGRVCGAACGFLFDWDAPASVRLPLAPIALGHLDFSTCTTDDAVPQPRTAPSHETLNP